MTHSRGSRCPDGQVPTYTLVNVDSVSHLCESDTESDTCVTTKTVIPEPKGPAGRVAPPGTRAGPASTEAIVTVTETQLRLLEKA